MKLHLTHFIALAVLPFLNAAGSAQAQTVDTRAIVGNYRVLQVTDVGSQHVKLSLQLHLINRSNAAITVVALHPTHPVLSSSRVQPLATFVDVRPGSRSAIACDLVLPRFEYLASRHAHMLRVVATLRNSNGSPQTRLLLLHGERSKEVR